MGLTILSKFECILTQVFFLDRPPTGDLQDALLAQTLVVKWSGSGLAHTSISVRLSLHLASVILAPVQTASWAKLSGGSLNAALGVLIR